jgi:hypothetical protein
MTGNRLTRRKCLTTLGAGTAMSCARELLHGAGGAQRIKAFCIDFNWAADGKFAPPEMYAKASATEHFHWYRDLGVNTIQTFCVSCNGHAWYRSEVAPVTPGMRGDFLGEITDLAHRAKMRSLGYFCIAANTYWGQTHPELSHGTPSAYHIPLTTTYLDYLCGSMADVLRKVDIDGFMIDWVWSVEPKWIEGEKKMYEELLDRPFPGQDKVGKEQTAEFGRRAVERAWKRIHDTAKAARNSCILWLSCNNLRDPQVAGSRMLRELDWVMNEHPDPASLEDVRKAVSPQSQIVQTICGWDDKHDAEKLTHDPRCAGAGFYGFAKPDAITTLPPEGDTGNARNITFMRKAFHEL